MQSVYETAHENGVDVQRMYMNDFQVKICWIAKHFSVFIRSCVQMAHFMPRGMIRPLERLASKNSRIVGRQALLYIHKMYVGKLSIDVTMHVYQNPCGEWRFKSTKEFHPSNNTVTCTISTLHFYTVQICFLKSPLPVFTFLINNFQTLCMHKQFFNVLI